MTRHFLYFLAIALVVAVALPAFGDDQQKAQKEVNNDVSEQDLLNGRNRYLVWRNRASVGSSGQDNSLALEDEQAAHSDRAHAGGPTQGEIRRRSSGGRWDSSEIEL